MFGQGHFIKGVAIGFVGTFQCLFSCQRDDQHGTETMLLQSALSGQAMHSHVLMLWSVLFKYSPTLHAPHSGNSHPVPSLLGTFPVVLQVLQHFC